MMNSKNFTTLTARACIRFFTAAVAAAIMLSWLPGTATAQDEEIQYTDSFRLKGCEFKTTGANPYFILIPGYRLVLEGEDEGEELRVVITVLNETKRINLPGIGRIDTRVVLEKETVDGELVEISRNFFAICKKTNDVFYFGEDVDIYNPDGTITHEGAWRAGVNGAKPGIIMPGTFLLGSRYYQELAPDVALDRAEHVEMGLTVETEAGVFKKCVRVIETTPLEPGEESEKVYCPDVGLVQDNEIELVKFGFFFNHR